MSGVRQRLSPSLSYQSSQDSSSGSNGSEFKAASKHATLIARLRAALARFIRGILSRLCCTPPSDYEEMDWGYDEGVLASSAPELAGGVGEEKDYTVCSLVSDLGSNITLYFRSEEPVSLNMDISTGHTVLVCI